MPFARKQQARFEKELNSCKLIISALQLGTVHD